MPSVRLFRCLIALSWALSLLATAVDMALPGLLPLEWQMLKEMQPTPWGLDERLEREVTGLDEALADLALAIAVLLFFVGSLVLGAIASVAMACFRPWGRRVSLWLTGFFMLLMLSFGPVVNSAPAWVLIEASLMLWGAALALAYWSPLAQRFQPAGQTA